MPQKSQSHQPDQEKLQAAALELAAAHGWVDLTLAEVYAQAHIPLPRDILHGQKTLWPLVEDILASLEARVEKDVTERLGDSWRDNLFELLMTRFDLMQPDKLGYSDIMPAALSRPCQAGPQLSRRLLGSMDRALTLAQVPVTGARRPLAVTVLTAIYLSLLETWRQDDSPDMAKTMAAVDKRIGWLESFLQGRLPLNRQA